MYYICNFLHEKKTYPAGSENILFNMHTCYCIILYICTHVKFRCLKRVNEVKFGAKSQC